MRGEKEGLHADVLEGGGEGAKELGGWRGLCAGAVVQVLHFAYVVCATCCSVPAARRYLWRDLDRVAASAFMLCSSCAFHIPFPLRGISAGDSSCAPWSCLQAGGGSSRGLDCRPGADQHAHRGGDQHTGPSGPGESPG